MTALEAAHDLEPQETPEHALRRQRMTCRHCKKGVVMAWLKPFGQPATLEPFDADLTGLVLRPDGWFAVAAGGTRKTHDKVCPDWPAKRITTSAPHFGYGNEHEELKAFHDAEQHAGR